MADELQVIYFASTSSNGMDLRKIEVSSHTDGSMLIKVGGQRMDLAKGEVDMLLFLMGAKRER